MFVSWQKENTMDTYQQSQIATMLSSFFLMMVVVSLISLVISIIAWWAIFSKAGYSGALSLLFFIPIAGLVMFLVFAFGKWPILRELEMLRQQRAAFQYQSAPQMPSGPQYPPYQPNPQYPQNPPYQPNPQYPQY
jgi:uncharacterized membrane protein YhaH (DUF805 family)